MPVPPLAFFAIHALARFPDILPTPPRRVPASPALLDALAHTRDPCLWATLAQLVHPLPPHLHDHDLPLSHPDLPLLQKIPHSPIFSLVTLLSLPNCVHLRDHDVANLRSLHRLLALDLRGCSISSYALTALARGLVASSNARSGTWGLRLLTLHGCPNIDNDVLPALHKFPLLSVVDLRFTRCIPSAVNAHLSSLGFCPSANSSLFHPAPLSLALCGLEKVALTASDPISLYSCPPHSVFRVHIDELDHPPKFVPVRSSSTLIPTVSSKQDTVVFLPPLWKPAQNESLPLSTAVPEISASSPTDLPTRSSNASSFYENTPARNGHSRKSLLPLSAQAVQPSTGGMLDPLAIARSPPPWKILDICCHWISSADNTEDSRRIQPTWTGQALNNPLKVDRTRLHKRGSDAVADMLNQFTSKRPKIESEFARKKSRPKVSVKSRNPFARSVFAERGTDTNKSQSPTHEPDMRVSVYRPLLSEAVQQQGTNVERTLKPLKPITTLKPPILPKELLPSLPQRASKPRADLKQTRLEFSREVG